MRPGAEYDGLEFGFDNYPLKETTGIIEPRIVAKYFIGEHVHLPSATGLEVQGVLKAIKDDELIIGRKNRSHLVSELKGVLINMQDVNKPYVEVRKNQGPLKFLEGIDRTAKSIKRRTEMRRLNL